MAKPTLEQYLEFWTEENSSAYLYTVLAEKETDTRISEVYRRMAAVEIRHAEKWAKGIVDEKGAVPTFSPSLRTRLLAWMARRFGPEWVLPTMQNMEDTGANGYGNQVGASGMASEERSHSKILSTITRTMRGGFEGGALAQMEGRHRSAGGNALRAAVLGANDGLVSNLSLVMGVAGAALNNRSILITGLAGLLAGASSMALGEWLSVQSSRELFTHQIQIEKEEIESAPEEEAEELALIYESRGLAHEQAVFLATQIMANKESAVDTLAREELGVDPKELGGSAWEAAITSFILFAVGAIIPVVSFTFLSGMPAVIVSILLSTVGLFVLGTVITLFTGKPIFYSGMRMVVFGLLAAALTFGIGRLIGVSLAG
jgi:VIT1/CCC1 family predicted Fe2+/Mn2+ transporter